jgi:hypothetical protein
MILDAPMILGLPEIITIGLVALFALFLLRGMPGRAALAATRGLPGKLFTEGLAAAARLDVPPSSVAYWFGALAIALAGVYLVHYDTADATFSSDERFAIGVVLGGALLLSGRIFRHRSHDLAAPLSAAGYVSLLSAFFFSTHENAALGTAISREAAGAIGCSLLAVVVAMAAYTASKLGRLVGYIGVGGGFVVPLFSLGFLPEAEVLYPYLLAVFAIAVVVAVRRGWVDLFAASILASFGWALGWTVNPGNVILPNETPIIGFFVLGTVLTGLFVPRLTVRFAGRAELDRGWTRPTLMLLAAFFETTMVAYSGWAPQAFLPLLGATALAAGLAVEDERLDFAWSAALLALLVLASWPGVDAPPSVAPRVFAAFLVTMAAVPLVAAFFARRPEAMVALSVVGGSLAAMLLWLRIDPLTAHGYAGSCLAAAGVYAAAGLGLDRWRAARGAAGLSLATAAALAALGGLILVPHFSWLAPIAATLAALLGWTSLRRDDAWLGGAAALAGIASIGCYLPYLGGFLAASERFALARDGIVFLGDDGALALAVGGALIAAAGACLLRRGPLASAFRMTSAAAPFAAMVLIAAAFPWRLLDLPDITGFDIGWTTVGWMGLAVLLDRVRRHGGLPQFAPAARVMAAIALIQLVAAPVLVFNPFFDAALAIGDTPLVDALALMYLFPAILLPAVTARLGGGRAVRWGTRLGVILLTYLFLTLEVRNLFGGPMKGDEVLLYAYSAVWMLASVAFFAAGVRLRDVVIRQAAIGMMAITLVKACLFDAPLAGGLFKVAGFLFLGASLLLIGWLFQKYGRSAFDDAKENARSDLV